MRLTKLAHAGVKLVKDGATLVIDPGTFGSGTRALAEADVVLITHEHADHLDAGALRESLDARPGLQVRASTAVAGRLGSFRGRVQPVRHGDAFTVAGFRVHVHGQEHARSHQEIPVVPNVGFLVDGELLHPGDALTWYIHTSIAHPSYRRVAEGPRVQVLALRLCRGTPGRLVRAAGPALERDRRAWPGGRLPRTAVCRGVGICRPAPGEAGRVRHCNHADRRPAPVPGSA
jgi:glyoxylase-like metal-dependent hydrolase (beta-lactamase superfamily II)